MEQARLDKVRKLLALSEDKGATEAERQLAQEKAAALMVQWGIEDAMLNDAKRVDKEQIAYTQHASSFIKTYWHEGVNLGCRIAQAFNVEGIIYTTYDS